MLTISLLFIIHIRSLDVPPFLLFVTASSPLPFFLPLLSPYSTMKMLNMSAKSQATAERLSRHRTQERLFAHKTAVVAAEDEESGRADGKAESRADGRVESRADEPVAPPPVATRPSTTTRDRRATTPPGVGLGRWSASYLRNEAKELEEGLYSLLYPSSDPHQQQQYEGRRIKMSNVF